MKKTPKKKVDNKVTISMKIGPEILEGSGNDTLEALRSIKRPIDISTKAIVTVSQGEKKKELVFTAFKLKRLFYPQFQPIHAKWLGALLK